MKTIITLTLFLLCVTKSFATDSARVAGDLKVGGIHFSNDGSTMYSANNLLKNKGDWSSSTLYSVGDVVQYLGSSYVCTTTNTNTLPINLSYWSVLSTQGPQSVHGIVGSNGEYYPNKGFTVTIESVGVYIITFNPLFSGAPDCVVTSLGHSRTSNGYNACELAVVLPTSSSMRISCIQFRPEYNQNTGSYYYSAEANATPFSFICMN